MARARGRSLPASLCPSALSHLAECSQMPVLKALGRTVPAAPVSLKNSEPKDGLSEGTCEGPEPSPARPTQCQPWQRRRGPEERERQRACRGRGCL